MAVTPFVFTNNVSDPVDFSGTTKIVCTGMKTGEFLKIQEENSAGEYQDIVVKNELLGIMHPETSNVFYLLGLHRVARSNATVDVGYVKE